jgi:hypothetical protein
MEALIFILYNASFIISLNTMGALDFIIHNSSFGSIGVHCTATIPVAAVREPAQCEAMETMIFIIHHFVEHHGSIGFHNSYFIIWFYWSTLHRYDSVMLGKTGDMLLRSLCTIEYYSSVQDRVIHGSAGGSPAYTPAACPRGVPMAQ